MLVPFQKKFAQLRLPSGGILHAAACGSGQCGAFVFTFDTQHDLTNAQQAIVDSIMKEFTEITSRRFLGVEDFLYPAPTGEKMVFTWRPVRVAGGKSGKCLFSGFCPIGTDLGVGSTSTHHGNSRGPNADDYFGAR